MPPEVIDLPDVVTGITLSAVAIQMLTHCIAECPLTARQRDNLNKELAQAVKDAVAVKEPAPPPVTP